MNRAQRYSGMTLTFAVLFSLIVGIFLEQAVILSNRKPEIVRTVVQSPNHFTATMGIGALVDDLAECQAKTRALQSLAPPSNREGQAGAVTPQPFVLHPGKTPLIDPTQDAYYRSLLRDGRFPTTGSDPGRPR